MKKLLRWQTLLSFLALGALTLVLAYAIASLLAHRALLPSENQPTPEDPRISELKSRSPGVQDTVTPFKQRERE
ncbi:MAG: hypothetical protein K6T17_08100 [Fimbriimonadales bacterium]|nr:hypothetical protein [Fimbriimonadales bacterium]